MRPRCHPCHRRRAGPHGRRTSVRPWREWSEGSSSVRSGNDVDDPAPAAGAELDGALGEREQGVVTAAPDVDAGVEVGPALADDDLAGVDDLAAEALDAEALCVAVAAVLAGAETLLVCHD